jgi:hypothetical protein
MDSEEMDNEVVDHGQGVVNSVTIVLVATIS